MIKHFKSMKVIVSLTAAALFFAGCGGEYSGLSADNRISGGAVSASVVSGQVVSASAVSGQAVSDTGGYSRYTYCSDWNLYYIKDCYSEDARLVERDLEKGSERKIRVKRIHEVCYADNDWVYYTKEAERERDGEVRFVVDEVWRSPINKNSFQMDQTAEELVLRTENEGGLVLSIGHVGIYHRGVQCDGRYIVFVGGEYTEEDVLETPPRVYDMQKRSYVWEEIFRTDSFSDSMEEMILWGGSVFLHDDEKGELVRVNLETGEMTTVASEENYDHLYSSSISAVSETNIFWRNTKEEKREIWQYDLRENKSSCFVTEEELRKLLEQRGLLKCSIGRKEHTYGYEACFVRENRLYMQVVIDGEGKNGEVCQNRVVLSKEFRTPDAVLECEDKLNECLSNPKERLKLFSKKWDGIYGRQPCRKKAYFKARGFCASMTEDECLMYLENSEKKKNMPAVYDFRTGSLRYLQKGEDWLSRYTYDRNNRMLSGDPGEFFEDYEVCDRMPNNYDTIEAKEKD